MENTMENSDIKDAEGIFEESTPLKPGKSERQWAMACHLAALAGYLMPYLAASFLAPLIIWLIKREEGTFVDEQGKEALNFQLSLLVYAFVCALLFFVAVGIFLVFPLIVFGFVCPIVGAVKASEGISFRYPICIRFIK
jgi:uncharacterized Tic20 family protein